MTLPENTTAGTVTYCSLCTMIGNTEGTIPATCANCMPPRHPVCATCWPYPGDPCVCQMAAHA